jgi:hypothetical protein
MLLAPSKKKPDEAPANGEAPAAEAPATEAPAPDAAPPAAAEG